MVIDCHVHICAFTPARGRMSGYLLGTLPFRFMRWRLGMRGEDANTEQQLENLLVGLIHQTPQIDAVVLLAFDAVHTDQGVLDRANTHIYVTNDYAIELCQRHPRELLLGASIHPYRKDAVAELDDGLQADERPIDAEDESADEKPDALVRETAHLLVDAIDLLRADSKLAARVIPETSPLKALVD